MVKLKCYKSKYIFKVGLADVCNNGVWAQSELHKYTFVVSFYREIILSKTSKYWKIAHLKICLSTKSIYSTLIMISVTLLQVSQHDSSVGGWMVVYDQVCDVTAFLAAHPGGQEVKVNYLGLDATIAFHGVGGW